MAKKLFYSSTDADTLAASDFAGVHLYASDTKLTRTTVGGKEALDVNITNDIAVALNGVYDAVDNLLPDNAGLIGNTRAASPDETGQVERITVGAASADNVVAANVHGLDTNSFGMVYDGTAWDRMLGTGGAVHIHDGGNTITVDGTVAVTQSTSPWVVSDAALANTAILATPASVTTTSAVLVASALANRKYMYLYNNGSKAIEIGPSGVAAGSGFPIYPGVYFELRLGAAVALHADAVSGTQDVRVLEAA
jgi:hypothetical protein